MIAPKTHPSQTDGETTACPEAIFATGVSWAYGSISIPFRYELLGIRLDASTCPGAHAMSANIRKRSQEKRPSGSVYKSADIFAWAKYWDCTQQEVRDAARGSGVMVVDMQDWIDLNVAR